MSMRSEEREVAQRRGNTPVLTETEARQGVTPHVTRFVLGWGLSLVILAFCLVYVFRL
ncbi:MAG TPA: hypothetical protein VKA03_07120 [Methylovirgula sp.]|nr:hypothetical protein [Methylovirgula sp.]